MSSSEPEYVYEGKIFPELADGCTVRHAGREYSSYVADPKLIKAVKLAIKLKRPLLLAGEPGCGKTRLADAIAYEFTRTNRDYLEAKGLDWWPYYTWNVKSLGQARDGLYRFDGVGRLRDAQLLGADPQRLEEYLGKAECEKLKERLLDPLKKQYWELGPLGKALTSEIERPILLIDEIDKADSDLPNDLLMELDRKSFEIPEIDKTYPEGDLQPEPIVIITSNQERPLPEPFLRRCLYFYLGFPEDGELQKIIRSRFGDWQEQRKDAINDVVRSVREIRELLAGQPGSKAPGTSELLDFLEALKDDHTAEGWDELTNNPHLLGILLKTQADQDLYRQVYEAPADV